VGRDLQAPFRKIFIRPGARRRHPMGSVRRAPENPRERQALPGALPPDWLFFVLLQPPPDSYLRIKVFQTYNLLAGVVFGLIGWIALRYGKAMGLWKPAAIGVLLMAFPYFFSNVWLLWGVGAGLLVLLWFNRAD
jgi:hypothetical protein